MFVSSLLLLSVDVTRRAVRVNARRGNSSDGEVPASHFAIMIYGGFGCCQGESLMFGVIFSSPCFHCFVFSLVSYSVVLRDETELQVLPVKMNR